MFDALLKTATSLAMPGGHRARLTVLLYHNVPLEQNRLRGPQTLAPQFEQELRVLKRWFNVLPLSEAVERLYADDLPERAVCLTFDDGYHDAIVNTVPILKRFGFSATYFIVANSLDGQAMWNDRVVAGLQAHSSGELDLREFGLGMVKTATEDARGELAERIFRQFGSSEQPTQLALADAICAQAQGEIQLQPTATEADLRQLVADGMGVGCHTLSHKVLSRVDVDTARHEMLAGRQRIEQAIDQPVELLAYPVGSPGIDIGAREAALARALGFKAAFTTGWGAATPKTDAFFMPRFIPWQGSDFRHLLRYVWNARWLKPDRPEDFPSKATDDSPGNKKTRR